MLPAEAVEPLSENLDEAAVAVEDRDSKGDGAEPGRAYGARLIRE